MAVLSRLAFLRNGIARVVGGWTVPKRISFLGNQRRLQRSRDKKAESDRQHLFRCFHKFIVLPSSHRQPDTICSQPEAHGPGQSYGRQASNQDWRAEVPERDQRRFTQCLNRVPEGRCV